MKQSKTKIIFILGFIIVLLGLLLDYVSRYKYFNRSVLFYIPIFGSLFICTALFLFIRSKIKNMFLAIILSITLSIIIIVTIGIIDLLIGPGILGSGLGG